LIIDSTGRRLIAKLQENGRATLTELGRALGLSHVGVRARLQRLLESGLIRISAAVNAEKLNMKVVVVFLEVESSKRLNELVQTFKDCPRLVFMSTLIGSHNLLAILVAEDPSTLESMVMGECSLRNQKGVRRSEIYIGEAVIYPVHLPIRLVTERREVAPCRMRCDTCDRYQSEKCLACPATLHYRGPL